jgi:hypothetical protein
MNRFESALIICICLVGSLLLLAGWFVVTKIGPYVAVHAGAAFE